MKNHKTQVLIVDDNASARETLKGLLFPEGYTVACAAGGAEALAMLADVRPDTILLDVMMPEMDGFEVCRRIKADEQGQHIPILLVTALDSKEELVEGLDAGADDFLSKPVNGHELRARVRSMVRIKQQFDKLQATLQLREEMAGMIVHDMRTPLSSVLGFCELSLFLSEEEVPPGVTRNLQQIHTQAQRLNDFLNDMLMLTKIEQGHLILNRTAVDLGQLVEDVRQDHAIMARSRKVELVIEQPADPGTFPLDANLFRRVLDNLLSNALKFSPNESTVTLRLEHLETGATDSQSSLLLQVLDEGSGVPAEHRDRIFDKFSIIELKQKGVSQVGLGLSFAKMIVEAHGGKIYVEENAPQGAVFSVELFQPPQNREAGEQPQ